MLFIIHSANYKIEYTKTYIHLTIPWMEIKSSAPSSKSEDVAQQRDYWQFLHSSFHYCLLMARYYQISS